MTFAEFSRRPSSFRRRGCIVTRAAAALPVESAVASEVKPVPPREIALQIARIRRSLVIACEATPVSTLLGGRSGVTAMGDDAPTATASGLCLALGTAGLASLLLAVLIAVASPTRRTGYRPKAALPARPPDLGAGHVTPGDRCTTRIVTVPSRITLHAQGVATTKARFTGQTVLVTGGGTGIGRAVAQTFALQGAAVIVAGRFAEPLSQTIKLIEADGGRAAAITADVSKSKDLAALVTLWPLTAASMSR
jgi:3-oxoacyl-ACP reductase-like protein